VSALAPEIEQVAHTLTMRVSGRVAALRGLTVLVDDLPLPAGAVVRLGQSGETGEVVGFEGGRAIVMPFGSTTGLRAGETVEGVSSEPFARIGPRSLGRVVNAFGDPIDAKGPIHETQRRALYPPPITPMQRSRIDAPLSTGVRAIDGLLTVGRGQRLGVFAGPGVGKSTLMGSMARHTNADVNVIAMIGERGREVREFVEDALGEEGLKRSVVVAATSDESPLLRIRAFAAACTAAEFFRDQGRDVMLMVDSATRFAQAQRQVGLAAGEPPATKGYTPSVFAMLPQLLERAGAVEGAGSITGFYTVLVEGDDMTEPIADAARGVLDGHIVLSRRLARLGHYPAIDPLDSISRVADEVCDDAHIAARREVLRLLASYSEIEDLVQIGAYSKGASARADVAIDMKTRIDEFLQQGSREQSDFQAARGALAELAMEAGDRLGAAGKKG